MILFYLENGVFKIPLIQRPLYDGTHGGQISLPGGKMELEDESLKRTALRETQEEIGVKLIDIEVIGELSQIYIPPSNFFVKPFVGIISYVPEFFPDEKEVAEIITIELDDIFNDQNITKKVIETRYGKFNTTVFLINGKVIWGATALMLAELREILLAFSNHKVQ